MKFMRKSDVFEATQWFKNGDHPGDYARDHDGYENGEVRVFTGEERKARGWEGDVVRYFRSPLVSGLEACALCGAVMHDHGWIDTPPNGLTVCPGDWVMTRNEGEYYPCKPDVFAKIYVSVDVQHALTEALYEVMLWIDNFSPAFADDDEWPATEEKVRHALAQHRGEA